MSIRVPNSGTESVPNFGTAKRYTRTPAEVLHEVTLSFSARLIYAELALWVFQGRTASRGVRAIANDLGMSKTTVTKGIAELMEAGAVERHADGKHGYRAIYSLPSKVFGQRQGKQDIVVSSPNGNRLVSVEGKVAC